MSRLAKAFMTDMEGWKKPSTMTLYAPSSIQTAIEAEYRALDVKFFEREEFAKAFAAGIRFATDGDRLDGCANCKFFDASAGLAGLGKCSQPARWACELENYPWPHRSETCRVR